MSAQREHSRFGLKRPLRSSDHWNPKRNLEPNPIYSSREVMSLYKTKVIFRNWKTWFITSIGMSKIGRRDKIDFESMIKRHNVLKKKDSKGNKNFKKKRKFMLHPETMELKWMFNKIHKLNGYITPYSK